MPIAGTKAGTRIGRHMPVSAAQAGCRTTRQTLLVVARAVAAAKHITNSGCNMDFERLKADTTAHRRYLGLRTVQHPSHQIVLHRNRRPSEADPCALSRSQLCLRLQPTWKYRGTTQATQKIRYRTPRPTRSRRHRVRRRFRRQAHDRSRDSSCNSGRSLDCILDHTTERHRCSALILASCPRSTAFPRSTQ